LNGQKGEMNGFVVRKTNKKEAKSEAALVAKTG
jgi:hypothetical protein